MYLWCLSLSVISLLLFQNSLIKLWFRSYLNVFGVQIGSEIWTLVSKLQTPDRKIDICKINRGSDKFVIKRAFNPNLKISNVNCPPRYTYKYLTESGETEWPYEEGSTFKINEGILVVYKRERRGLGFINKEIFRGKSWPPVKDGDYIWESLD